MPAGSAAISSSGGLPFIASPDTARRQQPPRRADEVGQRRKGARGDQVEGSAARAPRPGRARRADCAAPARPPPAGRTPPSCRPRRRRSPSSAGSSTASTTPGRPPPLPTSSRRHAEPGTELPAQRRRRPPGSRPGAGSASRPDRAPPSGCRSRSSAAAARGRPSRLSPAPSAGNVQSELARRRLSSAAAQRAQAASSSASAAALAAKPLKRPFFRWTSSSEIAAGVTPEMRDAWPSVSGPVPGQLLPHLERQRRDLRVVELGRQPQALVGRGALDLFVLLVDVAGVLDADLDLLDHRVGQRRRPAPRAAFHVKQPASGPRRSPPPRPPASKPTPGRRSRSARLYSCSSALPSRRSASAAGSSAGVHPGRLQPLGLPRHRIALAAERLPARVVDQAQRAAVFGQPQVGVVLAQLQPELGPAGEHAVGLGHALGDQVVDQHAEVGLVAPRQPGSPRPAPAAPR